ncbi:gpmB [Scenedesmus sp. PABB004]|nr:gpmB [Scenedesmus sp. PABB004]
MAKRLLLVRHGESEMNLRAHQVVSGQSNSSPLTQLGRAQAAALGKHLAALHPRLAGLVLSSTAVRAADTAAIALQHWPSADRPELVQLPELLELSQGSWEGAPRAACYTPDVLAAIRRDPWGFAAPGGESQKQLEARVTAAVSRALAALKPGGPPLLVFTHGLAIKCFVRGVMNSAPDLTWKIQIDNSSVTELVLVEGGAAEGWHVCRVNDTAHLALAGLAGAPADLQRS